MLEMEQKKKPVEKKAKLKQFYTLHDHFMCEASPVLRSPALSCVRLSANVRRFHCKGFGLIGGEGSRNPCPGSASVKPPAFGDEKMFY
jgi:hypothetical protein